MYPAESRLGDWLSDNAGQTGTSKLQLPNLAAGALGVFTMTGALTYSGGKPVNIWLLLGVFCLLPLATSLLTAVHLILNRQYSRSNEPGVRHLIPRLLVALIGNPALKTTESSTTMSWLMWRGQIAVSYFQVSILLTFIALLLFNDIQFGWSSTLIDTPESVHAFFEAFTLPWQLLIPGPSLDLVTQSQFFYNQNQNHSSYSWWPHLFASMCFYGLIPRLILSNWLRVRTSGLVRTEVTNSTELSRFLQLDQEQKSINAKMPASRNHVSKNHDRKNQSQYDDQIISSFVINKPAILVAWQNNPTGIASKSLGCGTWEEDQQWIKEQQLSGDQTLYCLVKPEQTPTAELSDTLNLLCCNTVLLLLIPSPSTATEAQIKTWFYFANEFNVDLQLVNNVSLGEGHV